MTHSIRFVIAVLEKLQSDYGLKLSVDHVHAIDVLIREYNKGNCPSTAAFLVACAIQRCGGQYERRLAV